MLAMKYLMNEDGSIVEETRSFPIKQKESGNILIQIAVPAASLLYPVFQEQGVPQVTTGSSVTMGASMRSDNGELIKSTTFFAQFIKDYTDPQGRSMKLFQRRMPNDFVRWSGTTTLTVSAVSVSIEDDGDGNMISTVTSRIFGQIAFQVEPSNNTDDVKIDSSAAQDLQVQLNEHQFRLNEVKDWRESKVDPKLNSYDNKIATLEIWGHSVDGKLEDHENRLVAVEDKVELSQDQNDTLRVDVDQNTQDVADMRAELDTGFSFLGTIFSTGLSPADMDANSMPTTTYLNAQVQTIEGRQPQSGDKFYYSLVVSKQLDKLYTASFSVARSWQFVEIPPLEAATNTHLGSIQGTYVADATQDVLVDIVAGKIANIYIKDLNNGYVAIRDFNILLEQLISNNTETIARIIIGAQIVGLAANSQKLNGKLENELSVARAANAELLNNKSEANLDARSARQDGAGENIAATYRRIDGSYSRLESDLRFSRKTFNQNFYITTSGMSVPMPIVQGSQFSAVIDNTLENEIMRMSTVLENPIVLTSQQTLTIRPYLDIVALAGATGTVGASARIKVAYKKVGGTAEIVVADISDTGYTLTYGGGTERLDDLETPFSLINFGDEVELNNGDEFIVYLYMTFNDLNPKQVDIITTTAYPSSALFQSDSLNISVVNDRARLYQIPATAWTLNATTNLYEHTVLDANNNPQIVQDIEFVDLIGRRADGSKIIIDVRRNIDGTITAVAETAEDLTCWIIGGIFQQGDTVPTPPKDGVARTLKTDGNGNLFWE